MGGKHQGAMQLNILVAILNIKQILIKTFEVPTVLPSTVKG